MLSHLKQQARDAAAQAARKAAFGIVGAICLMVGIGFLTTAGWILLTELTTTLNAALIIGGLYAGMGLIMVALAGRSSTPDAPPVATQKPQQPETVQQIIAAFMTGVEAGKKART